MKKAFTLAEVLITLTVIGIVAALTMPGLVQNYRKKVWVTQLQKTVNVWENGMKLIMATDGVNRLSDTEFAAAYFDNYYSSNALDILKEYFNITKTIVDVYTQEHYFYTLAGVDDATGTQSSSGLNTFYTSDGAQFGYHLRAASGTQPIGILTIDVNGNQKPNTFGRDAFWFFIDDRTGGLIPFGSKRSEEIDASNVTSLLYTSDGVNTYWNKNAQASGICSKTGYGNTCAARIIDDGWKMDY
ncbi:MAG: type II secretion system GspH family protein [Heliobacteriaceae bacterium]|jgi:prepilin-type N-terminal cleavage/methylation domain-containing protein|nr:type II secretion system GspH family protein [Heliobacteriaceae bacterium]